MSEFLNNLRKQRKQYSSHCMPELEEVLDIIERIPTNTCGGEQPRFLFNLSFRTRECGTIVELGSHAGRSTIALAYGQKVKSGQPIYSLDCTLHPDLKDNLQRAGVCDWVHICTGRSSQLGQNWNRPIELLFIDANHSYLAVRSDIRCWARHVIEGGLIVLHDYGNPTCPGVHVAVHRQLLSRPFEWRTVSDREAGSLYVVQRLAQAESRHRWLSVAREELSISLDWLVGEILAFLHRVKSRACSGKE